jgi:hypothetical protein
MHYWRRQLFLSTMVATTVLESCHQIEQQKKGMLKLKGWLAMSRIVYLIMAAAVEDIMVSARQRAH